MVKWLKKLLGIVELEQDYVQLKSAVLWHEKFVNQKMKELQEYTRVDADIGVRGDCTVILSGVYKNKAFVRFYDFNGRDFSEFVRQLEDMKRHALIRNVDHPPMFEGWFDILGGVK